MFRSFSHKSDGAARHQYGTAVSLMKQGKYTQAREAWDSCFRSEPKSSLGLLGRGMVLYEDAPDGSEHGPAPEYRKALQYLGQSLSLQPSDNPIALWYFADVAAKLGTGFNYKGAKRAQQVWRMCALQGYALAMKAWVEGDPVTWEVTPSPLNPAVTAERFISLRGFHERLGYDSGDLQFIIPETNHVEMEPFHSELLGLVAYVQDKEPKRSLFLILNACIVSIRQETDVTRIVQKGIAMR